MKKLFNLLVLSIMMMALNTSCSSDDDEYQSKLPMFSDMVANMDVIYTDTTVSITAVQSKKGHLLDRTEYHWYMNNTNNCIYSNAATYDNTPSNPTCIFKTPSSPGAYTIIFKGEYNFSGKAGNGSQSGQLANGLSINEEFYPLKGIVTLKKTFIVKQK